ncbi:MAG TPA: hypothetical protein VIC57_09025 [Candidatus Dormibacteraeota bacterium]
MQQTKTEDLTAQVHDFYAAYADKLSSYAFNKLGTTFGFPFYAIADDLLAVVPSEAKLIEAFEGALDFYTSQEIAQAKERIDEIRQLTSRLVLVRVNWTYLDGEGRELYDADYVYVLRVDDEGDLRLHVMVSINEAERVRERLGGGA